jgi:Fe2+ transport system protein FeoA
LTCNAERRILIDAANECQQRTGRRGHIATRTLAQLPEGESGVLDRLDLPDDIARRLMELGFLPGHIIVPARSAPGGEPRVYRVDGSEVALRRETASHLILRPSKGAGSIMSSEGSTMSDCHSCAGCAVAVAPPALAQGARTHVVAIIGPPNSGKSTLFNRLTGLRQKVANFPGVTVEQRVGKAKMQAASPATWSWSICPASTA